MMLKYKSHPRAMQKRDTAKRVCRSKESLQKERKKTPAKQSEWNVNCSGNVDWNRLQMQNKQRPQNSDNEEILIGQ